MHQRTKRIFITILLTILVIFLVLLGGLILNSIGSFVGITTKEYRTYRSFAKRNELGMNKQEIFDNLGCPDGCRDIEGYYHSIMYKDREGFEESISTDLSIEWYYDCREYVDSGPYRLKIMFNAEGKSESIEFGYVPGG